MERNTGPWAPQSHPYPLRLVGAPYRASGLVLGRPGDGRRTLVELPQRGADSCIPNIQGFFELVQHTRGPRAVDC